MRMLLLVMSVSGSIGVILVAFLGEKMRGLGLLHMEMVWIKISILCYLLPFSLLKVLYDRYIGGLFWSEIERFPSKVLSCEPAIHVIDNMPVPNKVFRIYFGIGIIALIVTCVFWMRYFVNYCRFKKSIIAAPFLERQVNETEILSKLEKRLHIRGGRISIYLDNKDLAAFTIGIIRPVIVLPAKLESDRLEVVLLHEMYHIKRKDTFFKFLISTVICIHWFNPVVYLLPKLYNDICEMCCDSIVVRNIGETKKRIYAEEILNQTIRVNGMINDNVHFAGGRTHMIEERIMNIKENKNSEVKHKKFAGVVLTVVLIFMVSIPVCAYEPVTIERVDNSFPIYDEAQIKDGLSNMDTTFSVGVSSQNVIIQYDEQFTAENGNIYDVGASPTKVCNHPSKQRGEYQVHSRNSDGSCTITVYAATRCTKCGEIQDLEFISSTYFLKCTH